MTNVSKSTNFNKGFKGNFLYSPKQESGFQKLLNNMNMQKNEGRRAKKQELNKMGNLRRSYDSRNNRIESNVGGFSDK